MGRGGTVALAKKRKKKGRPSLLDIQKRTIRLKKLQLQQQQKHQTPNPNPNSDNDDGASTNGTKRTRERKKLKLVQALDNGSKMELYGVGDGSSPIFHKTEVPISSSKTTADCRVDPPSFGPTITPLPDKELLVFILDRLQKKDTNGVFSEPVDPNELPDYHEIIQHPMDFKTIRKKLADGNYENLEQFEKDVFLISSNAMHYNAPDTIFFRKARFIQELAKKDFENLRQVSDDSEPEAKAVPVSKSSVKNLVERSLANRAVVDSLSVGTTDFVSNDDSLSKSSYDMLKRGYASEKLHNTKSFLSQEPRMDEKSPNHRFERKDEFPVKGTVKRCGKKEPISNESRRNMYTQTELCRSVCAPSLLTVFQEEKKQMISVGLHVEYSYTRSLARFAANIGSVGWEIAAGLIKKALPPGTKFGPGWVVEKEQPQLPPRLLPCVTSPVPVSQSLSSSELLTCKASVVTEGMELAPTMPSETQSRMLSLSTAVITEPSTCSTAKNLSEAYNDDSTVLDESELHQRPSFRNQNFPGKSTTVDNLFSERGFNIFPENTHRPSRDMC